MAEVPNIFHVVDDTHVKISAPSKNEQNYALNVQNVTVSFLE